MILHQLQPFERRLTKTGISAMGIPKRSTTARDLLILLPSPRTRGEGQGVRGFALCFDYFFDREFNVYLRFRSVNK